MPPRSARLPAVIAISGRSSLTGTTIASLAGGLHRRAAPAVGMFVVLVMGATVTTTGSAEGCGRDWPLCNGKFVPDFALAAAIEFSHRAVTGVEGVLIVALTGAVLLLHGRRRPVQVLA